MELSKAQLEAVDSREPFIAVTAGAGSGKTRVLVERITKLISSKEAALDEILAITFTDKAAMELKTRLAKTINDEITVYISAIGTFHSFCAGIIRDDAPLLGVDPDFGVLEEHTAGLLLRKAVKGTLLKLLEANDRKIWLLIEELDIRNAIDLIEELIRYRWHTNKLSETLNHTTKREQELYNAVMSAFITANKTYSDLKGSDLDFGDLEILAIKLLENKDIRAKYQRRFRHILVDEFQDINDTQSHIISLLFKRGSNSLTTVGDEKQSIYRFRGANVGEFKKALGEADKRIILKENFRSTPNIIGFINETLPHFEPLTFPKERENGPGIEILRVISDEDATSNDRRKNEAKEIARVVPSLRGNTAVLFNSLKSSRIYTRELNEARIGHIVTGGDAFLEKEEIRDIINMLRLIVDKNDIIALLGLARSPYIGLSDEELYLICRTGKKDSPLYDKISDHPKGAFLKDLYKSSHDLSISEIIREYAKDRMTDDLEKLCHMADNAGMKENTSINDFVEYLNDLKKSNEGISEFPKGFGELILMTIHQAKGLEFDNIILCDTIRQKRKDSKMWCFVRGKKGGLAFKLTPEDNPEGDPLATPYYETLSEINEAEGDKERERLLYVAMTRARKRLIIPSHPGAKKEGDWHKLLLKRCSH